MDASFRKFWSEVKAMWPIITAIIGLAFWATVLGARADARITALEHQDIGAAVDHDLILKLDSKVDAMNANVNRLVDCQFDGRCKR